MDRPDAPRAAPAAHSAAFLHALYALISQGFSFPHAAASPGQQYFQSPQAADLLAAMGSASEAFRPMNTIGTTQAGIAAYPQESAPALQPQPYFGRWD